MIKKLGEMGFRIRPITKIGLSEDYGDGTILLMAVELGCDRHGFSDYLENIGLDMG